MIGGRSQARKNDECPSSKDEAPMTRFMRADFSSLSHLSILFVIRASSFVILLRLSAASH
jgi:hypothetical protein